MVGQEVTFHGSYVPTGPESKDTDSPYEIDGLKQGLVNNLVAKRIIALKAAYQEASSE